MTTTTFGEVSWDQDLSTNKKFENSKDLFLRLEPGSNELRLVTAPFQYMFHKYQVEGDKFGKRVRCSKIHGECPLCDTGDKPKPRWFIGVISRKTNKYQILDIGWAVFNQIKTLAQNKRFGDPQKYDIDIIVNPNGGATGYYQVLGLPKEPLTAEDQKIKDSVDLEDLRSRVTPPKADMVLKRMENIRNQFGGSQPVKQVQQSKNQQVQNTVAASKAEDEEDENFPSFEEESIPF